ncbi:MAG: hypothetical protein NT098_05455 [Candidatus Parcubacteria bacterium]|nr:hypothetical protein [Candidatus Parcubacteria bacterium]
MSKKIIFVSALVILIVGAIVYSAVFDKTDTDKIIVNNVPAKDTSNYPPSTKKTGDAKSQGVVGTLGSKECMEKFTVERNLEIPADKIPKTSLEVASLETFQGGAFFGKIKDYSTDKSTELTELIDRLMMEKKVSTYEHIKADVCLYNRDFLNPDGGGSLNYYVEHLYCTNNCETGTYELTVRLNPDGSFVGYRSVFKW